MSAASQLPITVLLPTRNAMPFVAAHVEALNAWLFRVEEIVVVDSESTDGTVECLRVNVKANRARWFTRPPGLYESWNFGIAQAQAPFVYIATVGDTIDFATLAGLFAVAQASQADVTIGVPEFVRPGNRPVKKRWVIHDFIEQRGLRAPCVLTPSEAFLWNAMHVPRSLLGSSASNLYRTDYLQKHPFPLGFGHACDTAWAVANSLAARMVIAPALKSRFLLHPRQRSRSAANGSEMRLRLHELAGETLARGAAQESNRLQNHFGRRLDAFWEKKRTSLAYNQAFQKYRAVRLPWWIFPGAWRAQRLRDDVEAAADAIRQAVLKGFYASRETGDEL